MRIWEIKDTEGLVLHRGPAKTKRALIEQLVHDGRILDRADFRGLDLSGMSLPGMRARGASFDGADMRGIQCPDADFAGASFTPREQRGRADRPKEMFRARLEGARMERAVFDDANVTEADFRGARLTHASFRRTLMNDASFAEASLTGGDLSYAHGHDVDFFGTGLVNADFCGATLIEPDFRGADLGHRAFGSDVPHLAAERARHLPDRTRGATVVAGAYDHKTVLPGTVPAMRGDARASAATRAVLWTATTLAVVEATHKGQVLFEGAAHALGSTMGHGPAATLGLIGVVGAFGLINHGAGHWLRDKAQEALSSVIRRVREAADHLERHGMNRVNLVCAVARQGSMEPLKQALALKAPEAARKGFWAATKAFASEIGQVVLCDRRHLALALSTLSSTAGRGAGLPHDVTVIRCDGDHGEPGSDAPCTMRFFRDGRAAASWPLADGSHATLRYGRDGTLSSCHDARGQRSTPEELGLPASAGGRLDATLALEAAALADNGLRGFDYPHATHTLRDGQDGTLLVYRRTDRRLDNPLKGQPALVRTDNTGLRVTNGGVSGEWEPPAAAIRP